MTRILLVEDEIVIALGVRLILEAEGYEVNLAPDGREGLELAMEESPDLIITDYMMPRMDGLAMVRALREAGVTTPVILATAVAESQLAANPAAPSARYDAYLGKPFDNRRLIETVRTLLGDAACSTVRTVRRA